MMIENSLKAAIRDVPDFPKPGIMFKDITPVLLNPSLCKDVIDEFCARVITWDLGAIVGVESRGFLFGMLIAQKLNVPFITVRKAGKLPYNVISHEYSLEYGSAKVEMHVDAIKPGCNVLVHDDLLATGGTAAAAAELIKMQNANVAGFAFLIELEFLKGRDCLKQYNNNDRIISLINY
jgi:adenine phosphoribosyltransferase